MLPAYRDILDAVGRPPEWWDAHGVPRFEPFRPEMLGIYDDLAILAEIACASCDARMLVGEGWTRFDPHANPMVPRTLPSLVAGFSYGDPPRHHCHGGGETMSCEEIRVVEAWERERFDWVRHHEMEGPFLACEHCGWSIAPDGERYINWRGDAACGEQMPHRPRPCEEEERT